MWSALRGFLAFLLGHAYVPGKSVYDLQTAASKLQDAHEAHQGDVTQSLAARSAVIAMMGTEIHALTALKK